MSRSKAHIWTFAALLVCTIGCTPLHLGFLKKTAAPVPPSQEIELLDPGQGTTDMPPVVTRTGPDGVQKVEVPPAVMIHRYYPSGDRDFQAQMLPGGSMIVVVNHPKTLERVYVPVMLPPGAPRVYYSGKSIIYDYGKQAVTLTFGLHGQPKIRHTQGIRLGGRIQDAAEDLEEATPSLGILRDRASTNP